MRITDYFMLIERRLQWKIAWFKVDQHFRTVSLVCIVTVFIIGLIETMGVTVKRDYAREYIPFENVLKKNFLLQEEVSRLAMELSKAQSKVLRYEKFLDKSEQTMSSMQNEINIAHYDMQVLKSKVDTFQDIVTSMELGKRKNQQVSQENIKLAIKLRESENEVKVLRELMKEKEELKNQDDSQQLKNQANNFQQSGKSKDEA